MRKPVIINFFGGPGAGKSTLATGVFTWMKMQGLNCEYVPEYAKELSYAGDMKTVSNQFYVSAMQHQRIFNVYDKVDYIITDSPVLTGIVYIQKGLYHLPPLLAEIFHGWENINFLIKRDDCDEYSTTGRHHSESEALMLDVEIEQMVNNRED
jgi:hypothetical protein